MKDNVNRNDLRDVMENFEDINVRRNGAIVLIRGMFIILSLSITAFFVIRYYYVVNDLLLIGILFLIDCMLIGRQFGKATLTAANERKQFEHLDSDIPICPNCGNHIIPCRGVYICEKCNVCTPYHKLDKMKRGNYILKNRK